MIHRLLIVCFGMMALAEPVLARRVALVIGQSAYQGGELPNPVNDARRVAELFERHGFDVLSCDGKRAGCFDLNRSGMLQALAMLEKKAAGADTALIYFAGHGVASQEGNILAPVDATIDCETGAIAHGIAVERFMQVMKNAKNKLLILDACRDDPIDRKCPALKGKKLSFTRIEAGAMQSFLLVTSTQFGQEALDGTPGGNSPFAASLLKALEANPAVYFEQVMNEIARTTYESAQTPTRQHPDGFKQIPGKVVGGEAPKDCLAGKDCIGDARMAALATETERLAHRLQCQAAQAEKHRKLAAVQRQLLSPGPVAEIRMGNDDAPVLMIEYCAFWSGPCQIYHHKVFPELKRRYIDTGQVLYIYRDIPSSEDGVQTQMIAHCMSSADRAQFLMQLFERQPKLPDRTRVIAIAEKLGFSKERIDSCLADKKLRADVEAIYKGGALERLGLRAIPAFFINSEKSEGLASFDATKAIDAHGEKIQAALSAARGAADACE